MTTHPSLMNEDHVSLCEVLDRVLNKGVVVAGEVIISVTDIDLIYLGLQLVLTSVETAHQFRPIVPLTNPSREANNVSLPGSTRG